MAYEAAVRRILPFVIALCASGCGGCVDDSSGGPAPTAAATPPGKGNPIVRGLRPHVMRLGQGVRGDDAAAPPTGAETP
jgi:hypothetical protein